MRAAASKRATATVSSDVPVVVKAPKVASASMPMTLEAATTQAAAESLVPRRRNWRYENIDATAGPPGIARPMAFWASTRREMLARCIEDPARRTSRC